MVPTRLWWAPKICPGGSKICPVSLEGAARSACGFGVASTGHPPAPGSQGGPGPDGDKSYFPPVRSSRSAIGVENRGHELPPYPLILLITNFRLAGCSGREAPGIPVPWELRCAAGVAAPGSGTQPRGNPQPRAAPEPSTCRTGTMLFARHRLYVTSFAWSKRRSNTPGPRPARCRSLPAPKAPVGGPAPKSPLWRLGFSCSSPISFGIQSTTHRSGVCPKRTPGAPAGWEAAAWDGAERSGATRSPLPPSGGRGIPLRDRGAQPRAHRASSPPERPHCPAMLHLSPRTSPRPLCPLLEVLHPRDEGHEAVPPIAPVPARQSHALPWETSGAPGGLKSLDGKSRFAAIYLLYSTSDYLPAAHFVVWDLWMERTRET